MDCRILLLLIVIAVCWKISTSAPSTNGDEHERIVMGSEAEVGQFPFVLAMFYEDIFRCTACVLSEYFIMTAAHCVEIVKDLSKLDFRSLHCRGEAGIRFRVKNITSHEGYDNVHFNNDIAMVGITKPMEFSKTLQPVAIANDTSHEKECAGKPYGPIHAIGWGNRAPTPLLPTGATCLQYADQEVLCKGKCYWNYINGSLPEEMMCVKGGGNHPMSSACSGDSGGSLVERMKDGVYRSLGIASFSNKWVCTSFTPTGYARVSSFVDWILEATNYTAQVYET